MLNAEKVGMGFRYWDASLSNIKLAKKPQESISLWLKNPQHTLLISGPPGTGKTYLCAAIINDLWGDKDFRYFRDSSLYRAVLKAIDKGWNGSQEIKNLCSSKYLIIDDFGEGANSDYKKQCIEELVDYRYSSGKKSGTVITTNLSSERIYYEYSARVHDRLFSVENTVVLLDGPSFRTYKEVGE